MATKDYRDIYIDLNSVDRGEQGVCRRPGADGLKAKRTEGQSFDSSESGGKRTAFDGDWKGQKVTEEEYLKAFSAADQQYGQMLTVLLSALKKAT